MDNIVNTYSCCCNELAMTGSNGCVYDLCRYKSIVRLRRRAVFV